LLFMLFKINFEGKGNAFLAFYVFQDSLHRVGGFRSASIFWFEVTRLDHEHFAR
jgi:hypothetical protein